jgi:Fe2+ transport system protein FeoA
MSSMRLAFSSDRGTGSERPRSAAARRGVVQAAVCRLSSLEECQRATVVDVLADRFGRADRLLALGITPGARVTMLQRFPGVVFLCDQTELAVERTVADAVIVTPEEKRS